LLLAQQTGGRIGLFERIEHKPIHLRTLDKDGLLIGEGTFDFLLLQPCPESFAATIGAELDKLAFNVAMGRDWAGIHYRSDAEQGIKLGEDVAISILQDLVQTFTEDFAGFEFTRVDGGYVRITPNGELEG